MIVNNKDKALAEFKRAGYRDCFINAYPPVKVGKQTPSFLRIIISKSNLESVLNKISKTIGGHPTVLDSGTELTIMQPVDAPILESLSQFKPFVHLWPSNLFLKFASEYLSEGLDISAPSFESCMIPIPGSINSKNGIKVKIMQEGDRNGPSISPLFKPFLVWIRDIG